MGSGRCGRLLWLAACLCLAPSVAGGQTVTASVTGTVRDSSGALVPGATVDIRRHDTSQVWEAASDDHGRFRLLYVPVGDYHLSVQLTGFTTATVNLTLKVG